MDNIQDKLNAYKKAISLKENTPAWIAYHIKTPLSKNITVTEWNGIVENIKELASDDEATSAYLVQLTNYVEQLKTALSTKSKAYIYSSFEDLVGELVKESTYETPNINIGDTMFIFSTDTPDFVVIGNDNHGSYPPDTVLIPNTSNIPTLNAGAICLVANKFLLLAIESGVSSADLVLDSELDINSSHAVMNSVITAAIQNLYEYFSGYTAKVDENKERINGLANRVDAVENIAKGANQAIVRFDYYDLVAMFNDIHDRELYKVGTNVYIIEREVPDLWISYIEHSHHEINAEDFSVGLKETIIEALKNDGSITIGYYTFSALETQKVDLTGYPTNDDLKSELRKFSEGYDIYLNNTFATKDDLNTLSDEFSQVLTELHDYAMNLKGGES